MWMLSSGDAKSWVQASAAGMVLTGRLGPGRLPSSGSGTGKGTSGPVVRPPHRRQAGDLAENFHLASGQHLLCIPFQAIAFSPDGKNLPVTRLTAVQTDRATSAAEFRAMLASICPKC
jgi:hypothetical protein